MRPQATGFLHRLALYLLGLLMIVWIPAGSLAQNLVPNPSFEVFSSCPNGGGPIGPMLCPPWVSVAGTADYYHACSGNIFSSVPVNVQGYQLPRTGLAYTGGHFYISGNNREYIQAPLLQTLEAGKCYKVGFYLNLGNISCGVNFAGALLTPNAIANPIGLTPQVDWDGTYFSDTISWVFIFDYVMATGNEAFITIGNFHTNAETQYNPECDNPFISYYFFDDVIVEEVTITDIAVDLEASAEVCDSYTIEPTITPDVPDAVYVWSDGSREPTLTVTTSGTYSVTVYYACTSAEASIDVEVFNPPPVDIGADVTMCTGDDLTITLDPDVGDYEWQDGSSDPDYTIQVSGEYSVALDDGCDITYDTIQVEVLDPPTPFSLGPDTYICPGETILLQFDPDLGEFLWHDGTDNPSYVIDDEGTYALTISNMCGEESDEIEVTVTQPPFFDIGPDTTLICAGETIQIFLEPTMGSFHWQDGNNSPFYTIDEAGLYSITVTNPCGMETDMMVVQVVDPPLVQLGSDIALCEGDTVILSGGTNTGNFIWQNGSTTTSLEVTSPGVYALSVTNICGFDRDSVTVNFNAPVAQPDLGPDLNLCPGEQTILSINAPGANIIWNDLSTADTLLVTSAGTYFVQVSNNCSSSSDTVVVTASGDPPVLSLPADFALCQGQTYLLDANVTGVSYLWNDMTTGPQLLVSNSGTYSLTVTNSCGSSMDTILIADGGLPPQVALGIDTSICEGTSILLTPIASNVNNWVWQDGSANSTFIASFPGEYYVTGYNSCGQDQDTVVIGSLPAIPTLALGSDTSMCPGNMITFSITFPDVDITWQDGSVLPDLVVSDSGTVIASIANSCGVSTDTLEVDILPEIPLLNLGIDQTICPGETILLDPGIPEVTYLWQDGTTSSSISVTTEGWITLMIANECGTALDSLLITESTNGPQLDLGPDLEACEGETVTILSNISGVVYLWQDGSSGDSYEAVASGVYYLDVSNLCGTDSDTIGVNISGVSPQTDLGKDTTLCAGNVLVLTASPDPMTAKTWQDGSSEETYVVQSQGLYSLTQINHCGASSDSISVAFTDAPEPFDLGRDTVLCLGETITLIAPATAFDIEWQDGSSFSEYPVSVAGNYSLVVSNECGMQTDQINVGIDALTPDVNLGSDTLWCLGDIITLDAGQTTPAIYKWNSGENTPTISVTTPGDYAVTVFTTCFEAEDEIEVIADPNCASTNEIYIPNIFSPNGDNVNDVFGIYFNEGTEVLSMDASIYDRWGNVVYTSAGNPFSWNGKFADKDVMPGVYVYSVVVVYKVNAQEIREILTGDVTLIR